MKLLVTLIAVCSIAIPAYGATPNLPACGLNDICDLQGPEDVSLIPDSDWIAVSSGVEEAPFQLVNRVKSSQRIRPDYSTWNPGSASSSECDGPPRSVIARGHDVKKIGGAIKLALINAAEPQRIELYTVKLQQGEPAFTWNSCVPIPNNLFLNDLAIGSDEHIFVTHMFDFPNSPDEGRRLREKFIQAEETGYALEWTGKNWNVLPSTGLSFPNGIAVSEDASTLAVGGTYSQKIILLDLNTYEAQTIPVPLQPDNITTLPDNTFLVAGHTGEPVVGVDPCRSLSARPCGFAFSIAKISKSKQVEIVFEHDGSNYPGASVAVLLKDNSLLLGSAFGDGIRLIAQTINKSQTPNQ